MTHHTNVLNMVAIGNLKLYQNFERIEGSVTSLGTTKKTVTKPLHLHPQQQIIIITNIIIIYVPSAKNVLNQWVV